MTVIVLHGLCATRVELMTKRVLIHTEYDVQLGTSYSIIHKDHNDKVFIVTYT